MFKKRGREEDADDSLTLNSSLIPEEHLADDEELEKEALLNEIAEGIQRLGIKAPESETFEDSDEKLKHRAKYSSLTLISRNRLKNYLSGVEIRQNFANTASFKPREQIHTDVVTHRIHVKFSYRQLLEYCHPEGGSGTSRCLSLRLNDFLVTCDERKKLYPTTSNGLPLRSLPPHRNALHFNDSRVLVKRCVIRGRMNKNGQEFYDPGSNPFVESLFLGTSMHERIIEQEKLSKTLFGTGHDSYEDELDRQLVQETQPKVQEPQPMDEDNDVGNIDDDDDDDIDDEKEYPLDVFSLPVDEFDGEEFSDSEGEETEVERMARSDMAMAIKISGRTKENQKHKHGNHHYFAYLQGGECLAVDRVVLNISETRGLFSDDRLLNLIGGVYPDQIMQGVHLKPTGDAEYIDNVDVTLADIEENIISAIIDEHCGMLPRELLASIPTPYSRHPEEYTVILDRALNAIAVALEDHVVSDVMTALGRIRDEFIDARNTLIKKREALCTDAYLDERLIVALFAKMNVPNLGPFGRVYTDVDQMKRGRKYIKMTNHMLGTCVKKVQRDIMGHIPYQDIMDAEFYIYTQMTVADVMKAAKGDSFDAAVLDQVHELCFVMETEICVWPLEEVVGRLPVICDEQAGVFFNDIFYAKTKEGRNVEYSQKEVDARVQFAKDSHADRTKERLGAEEMLSRNADKKRSTKRRKR